MALVAGSLILLGCGSEEPGVSVDAEQASDSTRERPCERAFVKQEVEAFLEAINGTSREAIDASLVDEPAFRVFSHGLDHRRWPKRFFSAKAKERVVSHLLERARAGDRTRLVSLQTHGGDPSFRICNLGFVVWRELGDRRRGGEKFGGKGAVAFEGGIAVWNTGGPQRFIDAAR